MCFGQWPLVCHIVGKNILPLHNLSFHFVDHFLCCAQVLGFYIIPLIYFWFCGRYPQIIFWFKIFSKKAPSSSPRFPLLPPVITIHSPHTTPYIPFCPSTRINQPFVVIQNKGLGQKTGQKEHSDPEIFMNYIEGIHSEFTMFSYKIKRC